MKPADRRQELASAVAALRRGDLVVYPTETFYGIAADPEQPDALAKIFALKGRSPGQPIALIAHDTAAAFTLASELPPLARSLAEAFWPGPLTMVLPARPGLNEALLGPDGVGVRVSSHPIAQALAAGLGRPITATSANLTGEPPAATASALQPLLRDTIKVILENDALPGGLASTVVAVTRQGCRIIRAGAISASALVAIIGRPQLV